MDLMMDLGAEIEDKRKKTKRYRTQEDLKILRFVSLFSSQFESCADVNAMMMLEKRLLFHLSRLNPNCRMSPKTLRLRHPARRARRWDLQPDS